MTEHVEEKLVDFLDDMERCFWKNHHSGMLTAMAIFKMQIRDYIEENFNERN